MIKQIYSSNFIVQNVSSMLGEARMNMQINEKFFCYCNTKFYSTPLEAKKRISYSIVFTTSPITCFLTQKNFLYFSFSSLYYLMVFSFFNFLFFSTHLIIILCLYSFCFLGVFKKISVNLCSSILKSPTGLILFTNPSARAGYDTRSIFKRSLAGLNSEFSFS